MPAVYSSPLCLHTSKWQTLGYTLNDQSISLLPLWQWWGHVAHYFVVNLSSLCSRHFQGKTWCNPKKTGILLMPHGCGKIIVFLLNPYNDVKTLWENGSALGPQRKATMFFFFLSDLFSNSPLVKYQPKISPTWSFPPLQTVLMTLTMLCLDSLAQ